MEIEDDDNNSNSNIYVNTPVIPPSAHPHSTLTHSTQHPHRPSLLSQFTQPVSLNLLLFPYSSLLRPRFVRLPDTGIILCSERVRLVKTSR